MWFWATREGQGGFHSPTKVKQFLGMLDRSGFPGLLVPGFSLHIMVGDSKKFRLLVGQGGTHRTWGVCSIKLFFEHTFLT